MAVAWTFPNGEVVAVNDPYYPTSCDKCGWQGSSEVCGTDSWGDDSDVFCPICFQSGADCGKAGNAAAPTVFYHAGPRGLDVILPPSATGVSSTASYGAAGVCRRDRVYVTTDLDCAVAFASSVPPSGAGWVYVVNPVDPQPDPDCFEPGLSFEARSAAIISIIRPTGKQLKKGRQRLRSMA